MLADGADWLAQKQRTHASEYVYYRRGTSSARMRATMGRSDFEVTDSNGMLSRIDAYDFLIFATDLLLDGMPIEPKVGDRILCGDLEDGQIYEVASIAGQDVWRWSDDPRNHPDRRDLRYRIHTKHVGVTT